MNAPLHARPCCGVCLSSLTLCKINSRGTKKIRAIKAHFHPTLIGQLYKVLNDFGQPIRILIHQAVARPFELNQPGGIYPFG